MTTDTNNSFKAMVRSGQFITAPGVFDLVSAKIDRTTAQALYMTGLGAVASYLGQPDAGLATYTDVLNRAEAIVDAIHKPLIADGDTGLRLFDDDHAKTMAALDASPAHRLAPVTPSWLRESTAWPKRCRGDDDRPRAWRARHRASVIARRN